MDSPQTRSTLLGRSLWLLVGLLPPTLVAAVGRGTLTRHWILTIVALSCYWLIVAIARPIARIFGLVEKEYEDRAATYLKHHLDLRLSRTNRRYNQMIYNEVRFIDQRGIPTTGFFTPELDEVLISLSLVHRPPHLASHDPLLPVRPPVGQHLLREYLDNSSISTVAVIGPPGSGKTTLLRHTAREFSASHEAPLPILLYLREHAKTIARTPEAELPVLAASKIGQLGPNLPTWLADRLRQGQCIVLFGSDPAG